jgi:hypothetical protein
VWSGYSRLPDYSHAGYRSGEEPIPDVPIVGNVKDFGAVGDGEHDDTAAFLKAIDECSDGAILIPEGRYKIEGILEIRKSNLVLRGEGPEHTVLYFPTPLNDIRPHWSATTGGRKTSHYSWAGGFIDIKGEYHHEQLTRITKPAMRGDRLIHVKSSKGLKPGMRIQIRVSDESQGLVKYLYTGDEGDIAKSKTHDVSQLVRIQKINDQMIVFDRPLRFDLRMDWKPEVRSFSATVEEVGVEDLGFEFPVRKYEGHFTELGYNPISMKQVANSWVRNIHVQNCDSGFFVGAYFCTLTDITFATDCLPDDRDRTGHHGYYIGGSDNLVTEFHIDQRFIHDISVGHNSVGNVMSNGWGMDLTLDHHKHTPYENLFTNIDTGAGTRVWLSGGGGSLGKHCAARGTFWNIRAAQPIPQPPAVFGPVSINLIAVQPSEPSEISPSGKWYEAINPADIQPRNLHEAQLARRLMKASK